MNTVIADGNNHISGLSYDPSGNTLSDPLYSYTWNAESQMKSAAGVTYTYDGDGHRVSKVGSKLYWYGASGQILAETDASGNLLTEYVFFGGKRIAGVRPGDGNGPYYYIEDFLGSDGLTYQNGVPCYDADFTPYGGERSVYAACSWSNFKFEGKERDTETSNDEFGARYYSNRVGRWLSADWSSAPVAVPYANLANPQTLNLYSMVADDPESSADLDGHYVQGTSNCNGVAKCEKRRQKRFANFEKRRQKDLKSKNTLVRLAAASYGNPGEKNGVAVNFQNQAWFDARQESTANAETNPYKSGHGEINIEVTFKEGQESEANIAHEGTHVMHDQTFLNSWNPATQTYSSDVNFVHEYTEKMAYSAQAAVAPTARFGPGDFDKIDEFLRTSPAYKDSLNDQVFPNSSQFPQSAPPDE